MMIFKATSIIWSCEFWPFLGNQIRKSLHTSVTVFSRQTIIKNYYTPKYAIWAFEQFDWFTLTILWLNITLIYFLWRIQVAHIASIYLLWWIRLFRQQFVINGSSSGRCSSAHFTSSVAAYDGFIKLELICLHLQASLTFAVFPRSASVGAC